jgi:hypothetical protein
MQIKQIWQIAAAAALLAIGGTAGAQLSPTYGPYGLRIGGPMVGGYPQQTRPLGGIGYLTPYPGVIVDAAGNPGYMGMNGYYPMPPAEAYYGYIPEYSYPSWSGMLPRTSDSISAERQADGRIHVTWQGEPQAVLRIRFTLLDKNRNVLTEQAITRPPAEARLRPTNKTEFYRVVVEYLNGTSTSVISPL